MIIANSKEESCIKRLTTILEKSYPGISFNIIDGEKYYLLIEVPNAEVDVWGKENIGLFATITTFSEGFVIGWEAAINS
jgi:hypothetical protein